MLRLVLLIVAAENFFFAYRFFFTPQTIGAIYNMPVLSGTEEYLTMAIGAFLAVFGLGAILPLIKPLKYGAIILMLLIMHFLIFLVDVIVLSRSLMDWKILAPEMVYFLVVSTALVRWYPVREHKKSGVGVVDDPKDDKDDKEDKE